MRTILKSEFEQIEFIPCLLKYFALNPKNRVTIPGIFPNILFTFYQDDNGIFHKIVDLCDGKDAKDFEVADLCLSDIRAIISHLDTLPANAGPNFNFKNMKEQVIAFSTAYFSLDWV